jgi:dipeptidase D
MQVKVFGLLGGHSGLNISEGRGNAVQLMGRTLRRLLQQLPGARLAALRGGDKRNAIAREAVATVLLPADVGGNAKAEAQAVVTQCAEDFMREFGQVEKVRVAGMWDCRFTFQYCNASRLGYEGK